MGDTKSMMQVTILKNLTNMELTENFWRSQGFCAQITKKLIINKLNIYCYEAENYFNSNICYGVGSGHHG